MGGRYADPSQLNRLLCILQPYALAGRSADSIVVAKPIAIGNTIQHPPWTHFKANGDIHAIKALHDVVSGKGYSHIGCKVISLPIEPWIGGN